MTREEKINQITKQIDRLDSWSKSLKEKRAKLLIEEYREKTKIEEGSIVEVRMRGGGDCWKSGTVTGYEVSGANIFPRIKVGEENKIRYGSVRIV